MGWGCRGRFIGPSPRQLFPTPDTFDLPDPSDLPDPLDPLDPPGVYKIIDGQRTVGLGLRGRRHPIYRAHRRFIGPPNTLAPIADLSPPFSCTQAFPII